MKVIMVSHGTFSKGIVDSVQMLIGEQEKLVAHGLYPEEPVDNLIARLEEELQNTDPEDEVLFCTDLFHGSPFNAVVELMRNHEFYHITGINLPLAVEIMMGRYLEKSAAEICDDIMKAAPGTIMYVNKMFEDEDEEDE